jgi:hypothetical protein
MIMQKPPLTSKLSGPTASIVGGPDRWEFLLALGTPEEQSETRRPTFLLTTVAAIAVATPIRLDALRRLNDVGSIWGFAGQCDRRPDPDNYDTDGYRREVVGIYDTDTRQGELRAY